ncbi:MAG: rhomboid family intramembrane serine protease, partial [Paramuribaculum sp.]|nr:rhomboid family intramembrane serine protease [Paramuribaculum sp.]
FMFGVTLERVLRSERFLFYYISCGIGAALVQEIVWGLTWKEIFVPMLANMNGVSFDTIREVLNEAVASGQELPFLNSLLTVGASGAIYGVLLAFGMIFPNMPLYIMFIPVPIKAKWMVIGYGAIELLIGLSQATDGVAHFAHLGGMLFGFLMIFYWKKKGIFHAGY